MRLFISVIGSLLLASIAHADNANYNFDRLTEALMSSKIPGGCELNITSQGVPGLRLLEVKLTQGHDQSTAVTPRLMVENDDEDVIKVEQLDDGSTVYNYHRQFREDLFPFKSLPYTHTLKVVVAREGNISEVKASTWGFIVDYDAITCKD